MGNKSRTSWSILSLVIVLVMVLSPLMVSARELQTNKLQEQGEQPNPAERAENSKDRPEAINVSELISPDVAAAKIDPALLEVIETGSAEPVSVYIAVNGDVDFGKYLSNPIERPAVFGGVRNVYGTARPVDILKLAQHTNVLAVVSTAVELREKPYTPEEIAVGPSLEEQQARMADLRANEVPYAEAAQVVAGDVNAQGWFDVRDGHHSIEAWQKGFTGQGVIVGVLDDGVDFAHPDLQGTTARVMDQDSPYYGWPMAFSQVSARYFASDVIFGSNLIRTLGFGSRWVGAQKVVEASSSFENEPVVAEFQPTGAARTYEYTLPGTSASGNYKFSSLPERHLEALYGHFPALVVVDELSPGSYDTVYVDLDNDKDFTDEKPVTKWSPEVYRDMDGDGYADISGGQLVWISDGANPPPTTDWLWGISCAEGSATMQGCPPSGDLVMFTGPFETGYSHGTQCASNVAGQGLVHGGLLDVPYRVGGMVQGAAPQVGVMDFSNHYFAGTDEDEYLVAALGYDGVPESGDEVQITSNSYGSFGQMWGAFGYVGRLVTALNLTVAPSTVWMFSAGNEGPGYGPQEGDGGMTTIQVGSSTQFGSTDWDSASSYDMIPYGDVTTFFSKGPNRDGSSGLDVLANGGRGAGDHALNYYGFNGWTSWSTWGGTSRSAPVAAGNLALVYDAYYARHGEWPDWETAKALLKSGADDASSAPFYQGAGVVNADRSTDLAAGIYGVYATPTEWQVGDWMGEDYPGFAHVAEPGESYSKTYTLNNQSDRPITVDLSEGVMSRIGEEQMTWTITPENYEDESPFNFHSPDYLQQIDPEIIPADTELMVVRFTQPYDQYDPLYDFAPNPDNSWRFLVYRWEDVNGDNMLWEDRNENGVVNHVGNGMFDNDGFERLDFEDPLTEMQEGEYIRMDYDFGGLSSAIYIRDPHERMHDGLFLGLQHRFFNPDLFNEETTIFVSIEFYQRADWNWLSLSDSAVTVPPRGTAEFEATMTVPADAEYGAYEGMIFAYDPGTNIHEPHDTALPVVVNVIADIPDDGAVTLGGQPRSDRLYQNSYTYGYFSWYGGGWQGAGDWRHFFLNVDEGEVMSENLLVHTSWEGDYPTDFNTWVLGPTPDCASNGVPPCASFGLGAFLVDPSSWWNATDFGQPNQDIWGPYTLWPIANSDPFVSGTAYPFSTSTGESDDWLIVPLDQEGLHEIALHQVLYDGEDTYSQFTVDVGTIEIEASSAQGEVEVGEIVYADVYTDSGSIELQFTPTLDIPDLNAMLSGGLETFTSDIMTSTVPDAGETYDPWDPNNVFEYITVDETGATELGVHLYTPAGQDPDMFLIYDANDNGVPDEGIDPVVGSSGSSTGTDEEIVLSDPAVGGYFVVLHGYNVDPDSGVEMEWYYWYVYPGGLPSEPVDIFTGTVAVEQDDPFDPMTASDSRVVTTSWRTQALHATVSNIPAGTDVDIYVTNADGEIVARSVAMGNDMEEVTLMPTEGEFRLEPNSQYTVWVHGFDVPNPPVDVTLHVWVDQLNIWIESENQSGPITAGETGTVTIYFEKDGWMPGDPDLSARVLAGPSVLPDAFDRLLIISRVDGPAGPSPYGMATKTIESERGPSLYYQHNGYMTALGNAGDTITYTLNVENVGDEAGEFYVEDWFLPSWTTFEGFVEAPDNYGWDADGTFQILTYTVNLEPGESHNVVYTTTMNNPQALVNRVIPNYLDVYNNQTGDYHSGDINYVLIASRTFVPLFTGSYKTDDRETVMPGETYTYSLNVANPSSEDVMVYIEDQLPAEVTFVDADPAMDYDAETHTVSWSGEIYGTSLATTDFVITVMANDDLLDGMEIENSATIYEKFQAFPAMTVYDLSTVDDDMAPEFEVTKTVDQLTGRSGDVVEYTIVVENIGNERATGVELLDYIAPELIVDEESITGGGIYDPSRGSNGVISWEGDLDPASSATITFQATIADDVDGGYALINGAEVTADNYFGRAFSSALTELLTTYEMYLPIIFK